MTNENEIKVYMKHFGSPVPDATFDCVRDDKAHTIEITVDHLDTYLLLQLARLTLRGKGIDVITWIDGWSSRRSRWQLIVIIGAYRHLVDIIEVFSLVEGKELTVIVNQAEPLATLETKEAI